jgi:tetratricopeptide (TPR) repeat protein
MLEIHPEDKDRMREFQHNHRSYGTIFINLVFLMGLAAAGAYFGHPEWFGDHRWQSTETPSEGGPADNEFETLYTTYAIPPLRQATAASQEVHPYLVTLSREPCNKTAIYQLTINLEKKIGLRSTATILQGYANTCPDAAGEQYRAAELFYLSGDYLGSIKIATQVLAIQPSASYAFYLRGRALQNQRRFEQALQDYTATIQLTPDGKKISSEVFMRMSQSYEALNKYCEAITPIQLYIAYDPETRSSLPLETKISELSKRGNCPAQAKGQARFPRRNSGTLTLSAEINGIPGNFIP